MTFGHTPSEKILVPLATCDLHDNACDGGQNLSISRNAYDPSTGTSSPRVPLNDASGFLDASTVYGQDSSRQSFIRTFAGGKLKADPTNGVPPNTAAVDMASAGHVDIRSLRLGGDVRYVRFSPFGSPLSEYFACRVNENPGLLAVHGLWVLEHNRLCDELFAANPSWNDERLFNEARKLVIAFMQHITATEYLPILMGEPLPTYTGYSLNTNPSPEISFSAAAYRYGHSGINTQFWCFEEDGSQCSIEPLLLRDTYMQADYLDSISIAHLIRGMVRQPENGIDTSMVDDARNHLLGLQQDLAAIDIVRCRDMGCPTYARARTDMGLGSVNSFADITPDIRLQLALSAAYGGDVHKVDLWVGGLAEPPHGNGLVGKTFAAIIRKQFVNTRDGDRFWYENRDRQPGTNQPYLTDAELALVRSTTLQDIIVRNTDFKSCPQTPLRVPTQAKFFKTQAELNAESASPSPAPQSSESYGSRTVVISPDVQMQFDPIQPTDTHIELTVILNSETGWVGVGFGASMVGADIWTISAPGGVASVQDRHAPAYSTPPADSSQDVEATFTQVANGKSVITVRRLLNTGDSNDAALSSTPPTDGTTDMIFSWGMSSTSISYHATDRAQIPVMLHA